VVSVTPRPRFTPRERTPGTHWIGVWVGPRAGLDAGARRKILCPCRGSNPDRPARSQTLYCLSHRGSPNSKQYFVFYIPHRNVFQTQVSDINGLYILCHASNVYCDQPLFLIQDKNIFKKTDGRCDCCVSLSDNRVWVIFGLWCSLKQVTICASCTNCEYFTVIPSEARSSDAAAQTQSPVSLQHLTMALWKSLVRYPRFALEYRYQGLIRHCCNYKGY
jgi:hypothetical protein